MNFIIARIGSITITDDMDAINSILLRNYSY
mgnify:CR=1 FL=1